MPAVHSKPFAVCIMTTCSEPSFSGRPFCLNHGPPNWRRGFVKVNSKDRVSSKRKTSPETSTSKRKKVKKLHVCSFGGCDYVSTNSSHFKSHVRIHTGEKPYACDCPGCEATFVQRGHLKSHIRTHTGEKPHVCDYPGCKAAFTISGALKVHRRIHTGEKPYACDFEGCTTAFAQSGNLDAHRRIHTGEKPYTCDFEGCTAAFVTPGDLTTHKRFHTGEKPYPCHFPDCKYRAYTSSSRNHHEKYFHDKSRGEVYLKKKEEWFAAFCRRHGYVADRELHITYRGCGENDTWARLDFVLYREDYIIIISIDEFQHSYSNYEVSCDVSRMSKVVCSIRQAGDMRKILWLRFNPDSVKVDGQTVRTPMKVREEVLIRMIDGSAEYLGDSEVAVYYLFYDCFTSDNRLVPSIFLDPEYDSQWKEVVKGVIVK